jgi:hypothetical protein
MRFIERLKQLFGKHDANSASEVSSTSQDDELKIQLENAKKNWTQSTILEYFHNNGVIDIKKLDDSYYGRQALRSLDNTFTYVASVLGQKMWDRAVTVSGDTYSFPRLYIDGFGFQVGILNPPYLSPGIIVTYRTKKNEWMSTEIPVGETAESVEEAERKLIGWVASNRLPIYTLCDDFKRSVIPILDANTNPPSWRFEVTDTRCWAYRKMGPFIVSPDHKVVQIITSKIETVGVITSNVGHAYLFGELETHVQPKDGITIVGSTKFSDDCPTLRHSHANGHMVGMFQGNEWRFLENDFYVEAAEQTSAYVDFIETVIRTATFE